MNKTIITLALLLFHLFGMAQDNVTDLKVIIEEANCTKTILRLNKTFAPGAKYEWIDVNNGKVENTIIPTVEFKASSIDTKYECHITLEDQRIDFASVECEAVAVNANYNWFFNNKPENEKQTEINGNSVTASARLVVDLEPECPEQMNNNQIYEFNWTSETQKEYGVEPRPFHFQGKGEYTLTLEVINRNSQCRASSTKHITIYDMWIWAPKYFTPFSSFGKNDEFRIEHKSVAKFEMVIINRWGRVVYKSKDISKGWDGRINGRKAEPGVYFYSVVAEGFDRNEKRKLEGAVHLIVTRM